MELSYRLNNTNEHNSRERTNIQQPERTKRERTNNRGTNHSRTTDAKHERTNDRGLNHSRRTNDAEPKRRFSNVPQQRERTTNPDPSISERTPRVQHVIPDGLPPKRCTISWDKRLIDKPGARTRISGEPDVATWRRSDIASDRTARRITAKDHVDRSIIGEFIHSQTKQATATRYLPNDVRQILPSQLVGPDDFFVTGPEFLNNIVAIISRPPPTPSAPPFRFGVTTADLEHNAKVLADADFNFDKLLPMHQGSTLGFGSEFRPIDDLALLLAKHPLFEFVKHILLTGMDYWYHEGRGLSESARLVEMSGQLQRGNHKSVTQDLDKVRKLLTKDVMHGFTIPLPLACAPQIKGAMIQPLGGSQTVVAERTK